MHIFRDYYKNKVKLSFADHPFSKEPKHVWVICHYQNKWLLTHHKDRGLEFPGGKVELGETAEEAAIREVREETGGIVSEIVYIGQYLVEGKGGTIIKNVYSCRVDKLQPQSTYYETKGPVLIDTIPGHVKEHKDYSFIMKDDVLPYSLSYIKKNVSNETSSK